MSVYRKIPMEIMILIQLILRKLKQLLLQYVINHGQMSQNQINIDHVRF
jgi:hypothetical protein